MLDVVLGGHSQVASLGEFSFLGKAISLSQTCTCGLVITRCPAWQQVFEVVLEERNLDLRTSPYALEEWFARASVVVDHEHQTRGYELRAKLASLVCDMRYRFGRATPLSPRLRRARDNSLYLYKTLAKVWQQPVLIDSSKNVHKALALYEASPATIRVVYLTRDGRGVYFSRRSSGFTQQDSLQGWHRYNKRADRLLASNVAPEHFIQVRYEDIMAAPEKQLGKICKLLGLDFETDMTTLNPANSHLVNGNDMRFKGTQAMRLDERWRSGLTEQELAWFTLHERGLNQRLGYS